MIDSILDGLLDTLKIIPYLFIAFILLEYIEHKISKKDKKLLSKNKKFGPIIGSLLGALPQCGFSAMGANLFSSRVITIGTLVAIFLSTSDEMLPIMLSQKVAILDILSIIGIKVVIGIIAGYIIDLLLRKKNDIKTTDIHKICDDEHCHCEEGSILKSSLIHTINIAVFILIVNLGINILIHFIGEDTLTNFLNQGGILSYFVASLIGLIPNCASSVIITQVYLLNLISFGTLISGLLTGSGIGILLLFKTNKNMKENIQILLTIYLIGVFVGFIADLLI